MFFMQKLNRVCEALGAFNYFENVHFLTFKRLFHVCTFITYAKLTLHVHLRMLQISFGYVYKTVKVPLRQTSSNVP